MLQTCSGVTTFMFQLCSNIGRDVFQMELTQLQGEVDRLRQALAEERDARKAAEMALWEAIESLRLEGRKLETPTETARLQG